MSGHRQGQGRLATVKRVREILERRALGRLAAGERRSAEATARLREREEAYCARPADTATSAEQLHGLRMAGIGALDAVRVAADDLEVAAHQRDELRAEWSQASVQRKSVERLADRRAAAAALAAERAASRALDELVAQRRGRR